MRATFALCALLALSACRNDPDKIDTANPSGECTWYTDADADGYGDPDAAATGPCDEEPSGFVDNDLDCDDDDAAINPDAEELCNGIDDDCDGSADEDASDALSWYLDADEDGYGDPAGTVTACDAPDGFIDNDQDCDDADPETHPGAPERCDGADNDCDGEVDEDLQETWYADADGDGYGNADSTLSSCDPGDGWVDDATDCDDANSSIHPDAEEVCNDTDDDCDGEVDEGLATTWYLDADGDGFGDPETSTEDCDPGAGWVDNAEDCDDANSGIHPEAQEACNGYDDDCDGLIDDQDDSVTGLDTFYADADGDGYGDDTSTAEACEQPSGYAEYGGDCDDSDAAYNPGASEGDCTDPADYNCDGSTGYTDDDGDGYAACEDCDDSDAAVSPEGEELCDNVDNDCDGDIDEDDATDASTWYADTDGDGYGDAASTTAACDQPSGYVSLTYATDCDDGDATISPVAAESCDGVDEDCDGDVDEGVMDTFYADADGDGYGDAGSTTEACDLPSGYSADDTDCDDGDASISPGADETCDGADNDCDGTVDETDAVDAATWYRDGDSDGHGDAAASTVSCDQPTGYVGDDTDCDDGDDDIHPGADEYCDGVDEDCDGDVDEDAVDGDTWYADKDGDGYGDSTDSVADCSAPTGYVGDDTDCDDGDPAINPAATETCDGIDNDCDGLVDDDDTAVSGGTTWYVDYDGDGYGGALLSQVACDQPSNYVADATDCNDIDASAYPGADELCDGTDNDCDGSTDEDDAIDVSTWYADADGDGYGDAGSTDSACDQPTGTVSDDTDCDDDDATVNPGATETCDGADNDCDGLVDNDDPDVDGSATWYADVDGDGYGDATTATEACSQPSGTVSDDTDCDDDDASAYPGATERCDGADNDCDGTVDEDDAIDAGTWYADDDEDGYGDAGDSTVACDMPSGYTTDTSDCDDSDDDIHPGATETCDGVDEDCDGDVDEGASGATTWYADTDADGYGDSGDTQEACSQPSGYVADDTDCDDDDASVNPAMDEYCNGVDDDCDGTVDGPGSVDATTWYVDYDEDGYGGARLSTTACNQPSGYVADATDCDDLEDQANPGATEICDGIDNDCDGDVDADDADISDASDWYADADADGYGDPATSTHSCDAPSGYVADDTDCDDSQDTVNPGASELYDSQDNDCDGDIDEDLWVGTGADGDLEVTGTTELSDDASGTRTEADAVAYGVTAISGNTVTVDDTIAGIDAGDEVLLINLQGSDTYNSAVGTYEFASVSSVSGSDLELAESVSQIYGESSNSDLSDQVIVLQRVPHYQDVYVYAGGTLTTEAWDGGGGGVLAFRAAGSVWVEDGGTISVSELGYAAGDTGTCNNCDAFQGESIAGEGIGDQYGGPYNESIGGYLANYGGGGANVTGGGGNYGGGATAGDSWNGGRYTAPEAGETYGEDDLDTLFLGSGGGGVWNGGYDVSGEDPGPGGDGAGILYLGCGSFIADGANALVSVGGTTDHWASGSWTYGAGGGSGGSVFLIAEDVELAADSVDAQGGFGESTHIRVGGDGGYGRVRIDCNSCNGYSHGSTDANNELEAASEPDPGHSDTPASP